MLLQEPADAIGGEDRIGAAGEREHALGVGAGIEQLAGLLANHAGNDLFAKLRGLRRDIGPVEMVLVVGEGISGRFLERGGSRVIGDPAIEHPVR